MASRKKPMAMASKIRSLMKKSYDLWHQAVVKRQDPGIKKA
jgi:hypothetical protein